MKVYKNRLCDWKKCRKKPNVKYHHIDGWQKIYRCNEHNKKIDKPGETYWFIQ